MKACWVPISADPKGNYLASPGGRYAVLLSVDSRASQSDVTDELKKNDFSVTYIWQSGQPFRMQDGHPQFFVDGWLMALPPPTAGTFWMYIEMNFTGDMPKTFAKHVQKCVLFVCGSVDIAYAFEAQQVPDNTSPCGPGDPQTGTCPPLQPPCAACPPQPVPWKPAAAGAGAGAVLVGLIWWLAG